MDSASGEAKCVSQWSVGEVSKWLEQQDLQYASQVFEEQDVDGRSLVDLKDEDLKTCLGIKSFGKRKQMLRAIASLVSSSGQLQTQAEHRVGGNVPHASTAVASSGHACGSQIGSQSTIGGGVAQVEGAQSHSDLWSMLDQSDDSQMKMTALTIQPDFQTLYGNISANQVNELVVAVKDAKDKQKGLWLKGTLISRPEAGLKVTFKTGYRKNTTTDKCMFWLSDENNSETRVTFMGPAAERAVKVLVPHKEYFVGELMANAVDKKWVRSGIEFVSFDGGEVLEVPKEKSSQPLHGDDKKFSSFEKIGSTKFAEIVQVKGAVTDVGPLSGAMPMRKIMISEQISKKSVVVTLWRKLAGDFSPENVGHYVALYGLKVSSFQGRVELTSTPTTFWEFGTLAEWWQDADLSEFQVLESTIEAPLRDAEVVPVSALHGFELPLTVVIRVRVTMVEKNNYEACEVCHSALKKTYRDETPFYCWKCERGRTESVAMANGHLDVLDVLEPSNSTIRVKVFGHTMDTVDNLEQAGKLLNASLFMKITGKKNAFGKAWVAQQLSMC